MTKPAPYPPDTKAKGWRFELDLERIIQSDTWALAAEIPMAQQTLLMMWAVAWQQVPCGSMPSDPSVIRAKVKVPPKLWAPMQSVVMRGWWLADDGRLYHDAITERVVGMIATKDAERVRKAEFRQRKDAERQAKESRGVPHLSHGTDTGHDKDGRGKDDTGTGTGTGLLIPTTTARGVDIEVFPMSVAWVPSEQFKVLAKMSGLPVNSPDFPGDGLGEFIAYWVTQTVCRTQAEWDHALIKALQADRLRGTPRNQTARAAKPMAAAKNFGECDAVEKA